MLIQCQHCLGSERQSQIQARALKSRNDFFDRGWLWWATPTPTALAASSPLTPLAPELNPRSRALSSSTGTFVLFFISSNISFASGLARNFSQIYVFDLCSDWAVRKQKDSEFCFFFYYRLCTMSRIKYFSQIKRPVIIIHPMTLTIKALDTTKLVHEGLFFT